MIRSLRGVPAQGSAPLVHGLPHAAHGLVKTLEHRLANEKVADIELDDLRQRGDGLSRLVVEAVTNMDLKPQSMSEMCAVLDAPPLGLRVLEAAFGQRVAPGADMDFNCRGS